jgi:hypothetical protein
MCLQVDSPPHFVCGLDPASLRHRDGSNSGDTYLRVPMAKHQPCESASEFMGVPVSDILHVASFLPDQERQQSDALIRRKHGCFRDNFVRRGHLPFLGIPDWRPHLRRSKLQVFSHPHKLLHPLCIVNDSYFSVAGITFIQDSVNCVWPMVKYVQYEGLCQDRRTQRRAS